MVPEDTPIDNPVTDPPTEVVEDIAPAPTDPPANDSPVEPAKDLFEQILSKLDDISEKVTSSTPAITDPELPGEEPKEPGHGEPVEDSTPVSKPWTHRGFGRR